AESRRIRRETERSSIRPHPRVSAELSQGSRRREEADHSVVLSSPPPHVGGYASRAATLRALQQSPLDLLIIGGGIVGAGIARDAAMRGLRIGLVEQHDFAFGTSSRSSRLLHGGMR